MGSERSANGSSGKLGYLLTDNEPDRTENASPWALGERLGSCLSPTGS